MKTSNLYINVFLPRRQETRIRKIINLIYYFDVPPVTKKKPLKILSSETINFLGHNLINFKFSVIVVSWWHYSMIIFCFLGPGCIK